MGIPVRRLILGAVVAAFVCSSIVSGLVVSEAIDVSEWDYYSEILSGTWIAIGTMVAVAVLLLALVFLLGPVFAWWTSFVLRQNLASRTDTPSIDTDHPGQDS